MIVIVVGMHRSGTSALAGMLHLHGISMGSEKFFKPKPLPQNPRGFYENYDFRKLSDKILNRAGYRVKSFNVFIPEKIIAEKYAIKMERLIDRQESEYKHWGWKDPRICLTLHCWLELLESMALLHHTRIIFTFRRADSVANSLKKRDGLSKKQAIKLWCNYNGRALRSIKQKSLPTFYFSYESLLGKPLKICQKLFDFLEVDFKQSILETFIDPNLNRSANKHEDILGGAVAELTEQLKMLSDDSLV